MNMPLRHTLPVALLAAWLAGCASSPAVDDDWQVKDLTVAPAMNGAIYQAGRDVALFENAVARNVGDLVVIRLAEQTQASKSATTTTKKSTSADLPGPTIAGRPVTVNGTPVLQMGMENESEFNGSGSSAQSNRLRGEISATVVRRLANGNLVVRGQKWLTLNQGSEYVRVEGVIRPIDIQPDNTIESWKVANARIGYGGKGSLADANKPGLLARFFNSPLMPF
jgi:flagellar L-ring protein precursor FlgH